MSEDEWAAVKRGIEWLALVVLPLSVMVVVLGAVPLWRHARRALGSDAPRAEVAQSQVPQESTPGSRVVPLYPQKERAGEVRG
jgi:hypothetical protein